ncbi:MAG: polymerase [Pseudomonadota bacterium]
MASVEASMIGGGGVAADGAIVEPARTRVPLPVLLLLCGLIVPMFFSLGGLKLSAYRVVLLLLFLPAFGQWAIGRAGPIRMADLAIIAFCGWCTLSYVVIHGTSAGIEGGGILFVETVGAYMLARVYIRTPEAFYATVRLLFVIVMMILPFTVFETLTGRNLILEIARAIASSHNIVDMDKRLGLNRTQGPFPHPIGYGVFCGSILGLAFFVLGYGQTLFRRVVQTALVTMAAFFSLSSGPLISLAGQIGLTSYDRIMQGVKARWFLLIGSMALFIMAIEVVAKRNSAEILISIAAFSAKTGLNRLRIFDYGMLSVSNHPMFGVGFGEWERAEHMPKSIDMFWIVAAVRHGAPAGLLLHAFFVLVFIGIAMVPIRNRRIADYRTGYLISMAGLYAAGWTVHYWTEVYVLFMFLLGSAIWMMDWREAPVATVTPNRQARPQPVPSVGDVTAAEQRGQDPVLTLGSEHRVVAAVPEDSPCQPPRVRVVSRRSARR